MVKPNKPAVLKVVESNKPPPVPSDTLPLPPLPIDSNDVNFAVAHTSSIEKENVCKRPKLSKTTSKASKHQSDDEEFSLDDENRDSRDTVRRKGQPKIDDGGFVKCAKSSIPLKDGPPFDPFKKQLFDDTGPNRKPLSLHTGMVRRRNKWGVQTVKHRSETSHKFGMNYDNLDDGRYVRLATHVYLQGAQSKPKEAMEEAEARSITLRNQLGVPVASIAAYTQVERRSERVDPFKKQLFDDTGPNRKPLSLHTGMVRSRNKWGVQTVRHRSEKSRKFGMNYDNLDDGRYVRLATHVYLQGAQSKPKEAMAEAEARSVTLRNQLGVPVASRAAKKGVNRRYFVDKIQMTFQLGFHGDSIKRTSFSFPNSVNPTKIDSIEEKLLSFISIHGLNNRSHEFPVCTLENAKRHLERKKNEVMME